MYLDNNFIGVVQLTDQDFLDVQAELCVAKATHDLDHHVPIPWRQKSIVARQPHIEGLNSLQAATGVWFGCAQRLATVSGGSHKRSTS